MYSQIMRKRRFAPQHSSGCSKSDAVAERHAAMRLTSTPLRGRLRIAVDHLAGPPAGQAHQVALVAASRQPGVGEECRTDTDAAVGGQPPRPGPRPPGTALMASWPRPGRATGWAGGRTGGWRASAGGGPGQGPSYGRTGPPGAGDPCQGRRPPGRPGRRAAGSRPPQRPARRCRGTAGGWPRPAGR
jgi:hypothetical protein